MNKIRGFLLLDDRSVKKLLKGEEVFPPRCIEKVTDVYHLLPDDIEAYPTKVIIKLMYDNGINAPQILNSFGTICTWSRRGTIIAEVDLEWDSIFGFCISDGRVISKSDISYEELNFKMNSEVRHYMEAVVYGIKPEQLISLTEMENLDGIKTFICKEGTKSIFPVESSYTGQFTVNK